MMVYMVLILFTCQFYQRNMCSMEVKWLSSRADVHLNVILPTVQHREDKEQKWQKNAVLYHCRS